MKRFLYYVLMYFFSQYASWGSKIAKLSGTELWQQRSPMPEDFDPFHSLRSEKLHSGLKCGVRSLELEGEEDFLQAGFFSRIIGGKDSAPGRQPWQVSIKLGRSHFCGGSLIHDNTVVTAAHCVANLVPELVKNLMVTVGEYDLRRMDKGEQNIPVSKIIVHPEFDGFGYRDSDIALLYLKYRVKYGLEVQPICLPHRDDTFEAGMLCVVSGWGKVSDAGTLSNILQEADLPIIDSSSCSELLEALDLPPLGSSMLCAGFPDGGKDACQGDSGGPLACRRASGIWTLAGITSWGIGCAKAWQADKRSHGGRGSPGIFANVAELWDFVAQNMATESEATHLLPPGLEDCNSNGMLIFEESGHILHPRQTGKSYLDNSLCIWNVTVPEDKIVLVQFIKVDIEDQVECDHDYLTFHSSEGKLIGKVCGQVLPSPLLIDSNRAMVTFVSDGSRTGGGFEFLFTAVHKASEAGSGCGSVAVLVEEGKIDTANYPGLYPSNTKCHWLIEAPVDHVIKLEFEDFAVEISQDCIYDAVVVFGDTEEEHQLALLCGFSIPSPVWSTGNILLIHFGSDGENNFRGFKARFAFFPSENSKAEFAGPVVVPASRPKHVPLDVCGSPPFGPQWLSRRVLGREESCPHCWPWHVGLHFLGDYQCGGVIIGPEWVLTAAHCMPQTSHVLYWTVVAGDHDRILKESAEQIRRVKTVFIHQDFDLTSYDSDIALVQLEAPFSYSAAVRPVCLPNYTEPLLASLLCTVTGWGRIEEAHGFAGRLQQAQVPILNNEACEQNYYFDHPGGITARMLCAGFASSGSQDTCQGDSGSPLVCQNKDSSFTLYGIASWGAERPRPKRPGVYTRVRVFLDWIMSQMKEKETAEMPTNNTGHENIEGPLESFMNLSEAPYGQGCPSELVLDKPRGSISFPCCSKEYTGDVQCSWVLRISPRGMAKMTVKHLSIPKTERCKVEFFVIYEESQRGRKTLAKLCGFLPSPMSFLSQGPVVKVMLCSTVRAAFAMSYVVFRVQGPNMGKSVKYSNNMNQQLAHCRDSILTAQEGIIQSPGFPNGYSNTTSCHWRIIGPLNSVIRLDFLEFTFQKLLSECRGGLTIYGFEPTKQELGNFCDGAPHFPLKSRGPVVMLTFTSGAETEMKGFVLTYRIHEIQPNLVLNRTRDAGKGCPILDLIPVGTAEITSPNYPLFYPTLLTCTWIVYSASGNRLKAVIQDLATEDTKDCIWDSLSIYDGPDRHSEVLGHICGQKRDLRLVSSGSYLTVYFKTDDSIGTRGFKMVVEELNQGPAQISKSGLELKSQCLPSKVTASEERKCGIPLEDPFPLEEMSADSSSKEQGKLRLVGGNLATPKTWPWLVSLQSENEHFCAGTLIDERWVLTSGHCNFSNLINERPPKHPIVNSLAQILKTGGHDFLYVQTVKVIVGITYLITGIKGMAQVPVKSAHLHSNFSGFPAINDLTLLELEKPIQTGDTTGVICLPEWDEEMGGVANCLTAGWGATEGSEDELFMRLQQTKIPLLAYKACAKYWGEDIKNTNICGGAAGSTSCAGDAGGPLICKIDGRYKLIGVASWGSDECNPKSPTVYTRISAYRRWISAITNGKV